jgi:modulator of FtsH protease HflC
MRIALSAVLVTILLVAGATSFLTVEASEYAYVTQFGRPVHVYDGSTEAGLHAKLPWPIQSVLRLDRRLQVFDLPATELLTHDAEGATIDKTLMISAYVCWRIDGIEGADRFVRSVGKPEQAEAILGQQISSRLGALVGSMNLEQLISIASPAQADQRAELLRRRLLERTEGSGPGGVATSLKTHVRDAYGIDLVDIRLLRLSYPAQVREAIFDRIRSERNKKAADYQSEGSKLAANIRTQAEYEARGVLAKARANERRIKGESEAEADRIRNDAHARDPAFYSFLKKLEEYQKILGDNKSLLLLSSQRELFDLLLKPPSPLPAKPDPSGAATTKRKED